MVNVAIRAISRNAHQKSAMEKTMKTTSRKSVELFHSKPMRGDRRRRDDDEEKQRRGVIVQLRRALHRHSSHCDGRGGREGAQEQRQREKKAYCEREGRYPQQRADRAAGQL